LTKGKRLIDLQISGKGGILLQKKREARAPENVPKVRSFSGRVNNLAKKSRTPRVIDIPENVPKIDFGGIF
jgi:hypothetical protein